MVDELNITKIVGCYFYIAFILFKKKVKNVNREVKTNSENEIQPVARCMEWQDPNVARSRFATQKSIKSMPFWCLPAMLLEWKNVDWSVFTRKKINVIPKLMLIKKKLFKRRCGTLTLRQATKTLWLPPQLIPIYPIVQPERKKRNDMVFGKCGMTPQFIPFSVNIHITFWTFKHNLLAWCKWCRMISHNLSFWPAGFL